VLTIPGHKRNANQNHIKISPYSCHQEHPPTTNVGKDAGKKEPSYIADENVS
jgi:hypothetical protein